MDIKTIPQSLEEMKYNRAPSTMKGVRAALNRYDAFLKGKKPTLENAEEFIRTYHGRKLKESYINIEKARIRSFFVHNGVKIPENVLKVRNINTVREDKFVRWDEVQEWYGKIHKKRDKAMLLLLYCTGARANEFLNIDVGDFDWNKGREVVKIKGLKSSAKVRLTPVIFPASVYASLSRYLEDRGIKFSKLTPEQKKEPLFISQNKPYQRLKYHGLMEIIEKFREVSGNHELSAHWFRHSYCVWSKINGVPVDDCARAIGDTPQTVSRIYSHFGHDDMLRSYAKAQGTKVETLPEEIDPLDKIVELENRLEKLESTIAKLFDEGLVDTEKFLKPS
jgi:site-specific recombinase XerD